MAWTFSHRHCDIMHPSRRCVPRHIPTRPRRADEDAVRRSLASWASWATTFATAAGDARNMAPVAEASHKFVEMAPLNRFYEDAESAASGSCYTAWVPRKADMGDLRLNR